MGTLRESSKCDQLTQKQELFKMLECVKQEVQRKYHDELMQVCQSVMELKQRLADELLQKQKEVKQLHLQHMLERAQFEDLVGKQRKKFDLEKDLIKK